jgi:hypothetical protein
MNESKTFNFLFSKEHYDGEFEQGDVNWEVDARSGSENVREWRQSR